MTVPLVVANVTLKKDDTVLPNQSDYSSMKHMFPKTKVSHAILHENTSQQRHLAMALQRLNHRQERTGNTITLSIKNFSDKQKQKHTKWKREDEVRTLGMNLPHIPPPPTGNRRLDSAQTIYRSPTYLDDEAEKSLKRENTAILPYMSIEREHIKYLSHRQNTFVTRLPTIINVDEQKFGDYRRFCGSSINETGSAMRDQRFRKLTHVLTPSSSVSLRKTINHLAEGEDEEAKSEETEMEEDPKSKRVVVKLFKPRRSAHIFAKRPIESPSRKPFLMIEGESPNIKCRPILVNSPAIKIQGEMLFEGRSTRKNPCTTPEDATEEVPNNQHLKSSSMTEIRNPDMLMVEDKPDLTRAGTDLILLKSETGHVIEGEKF